MYDKRKEIKGQHEVYLKRYCIMNMNEQVGWANTMFYPLFIVRRAVFVFSIVFLTNFPEIQCNLFILNSFLVSLFAYHADTCVPDLRAAIQRKGQQRVFDHQRIDIMSNQFGNDCVYYYKSSSNHFDNYKC